MIVGVSNIITDAMSLIGATAIDETPTSSELALGLRTLNMMVDRWSTQRLMLRSTTPISFPLVAGQAVYTIGLSGAQITAAKPLKLYSAFYRDSSSVDQPIDIIDVSDYNAMPDKSISTGPPEYVAYDPGAAQQTSNVGTLSLYLTPDQAYTLFLETDAYLTEFVAVTDTVTFEPAYYEALVYNLAERLFRHFHRSEEQIPADILRIANASMNNLKTLNAVQIVAGLDLPGKISTFNIYSDQES